MAEGTRVTTTVYANGTHVITIKGVESLRMELGA